jgi:molybdate transport system substrate-binding protein
VARITTGDPRVAPHGAKAREWLFGLGMWEALRPKIVFAQNAAQTDGYVARREVDAAIGFASDAHGRTDIQVAYVVPAAQCAPVEYVAVPVKASAHAELAKKFTQYLLGPEVQSALLAAGFKRTPGR